MSLSPLWYVLVCTTLFFVFASGRMIPANAIITAAVGVQNRGGFMSLKSALQQFAIGLGATLSSQIVFINPKTLLYDNYWIVGVLSIFFGIATIFLLKKIKVVQGN